MSQPPGEKRSEGSGSIRVRLKDGSLSVSATADGGMIVLCGGDFPTSSKDRSHVVAASVEDLFELHRRLSLLLDVVA